MSRWNYFDVITVNDTDFPDDPQVSFGFISEGFNLLNRGSVVVEYSFDGESVEGDLNNSDSSVFLNFINRHECKIWFRVASGSADVRVEAWGNFGR